MNRQSITSNEVRKGADAQVYSICRVFLFVGWWVDLIMAYKNKDIKKMIELYKVGNSMEQVGQIFNI